MSSHRPLSPENPYFTLGNLIVVTLILFAAVLRFYHLDAFSLWEDELFSVATATQSGPWYGPLVTGKNMEQLQLTDSFWTWKFADPHPPLFEMLLTLWIKLFGMSDFAIRSLSASLGVFTLLSVFVLPRSITWQGRAVYVLLLAVSGPLLIYSQDTRGYALAACLSAWMLALLLRQMDEDPNGIAAGRPNFWILIAASLLALTHYYGILMAFSFAAIMTLKVRSRAAFVRSSIVWLLTMVPVGVYIMLGWVGIATKMDAAPPQALSLAMTFKRNTIGFLKNIYPEVGTTEFWIFMLLAVVAVFIYRRMRAERHPLQTAVEVIASVLVLFFLVLVVGTRRSEFFSTRYVIFMFPGVLLLVSIFTLVKGWPRMVSLLLCAFLIPAGFWVWQLSPKPQNWGDWRGASELVARKFQPGDIIAVPLNDPTMRAHFLHYLRKHIPSDQLDKKMLSFTDPRDFPNMLKSLDKRPSRVIVFSHGVFLPKGQAVVEWLQKEYSCTPTELHQVQFLLFAVVACEP